MSSLSHTAVLSRHARISSGLHTFVAMARTKQTAQQAGIGAAAARSVPPTDLIVGSAPDVFGPPHPLFQLVSAATQLPDVLIRIVVHYASHLFPRQAQYAGNIVLQRSSTIYYRATDPTAASSSSSSTSTAPLPGPSLPSDSGSSSSDRFSLSDRSWSMCGWMNRAVPNVPQFLLSVHATDRAMSNNTHVHIGYTCHPHGSATNCFTVGFYANDLDVTPPTIDVGGHHEWEHWCTTLHYPRPAECGPYTPPTTEHTHAEYKDANVPNLARRRLYRNGVLLAEDDCQLPNIDHNHTLLLGRYATSVFPSLHGGLCDVRLYSRALEADEVHALYAGEEDVDSSKEGLEVWYKLDATDFDARVVRDSSGHGRDAVLEKGSLQLSLTGGCNAHLAHSTEQASVRV